jgi:hypothetical protein
MRDGAVISKLQVERNILLIKERRMLEDYDDLNRQIRDLQKRDNDPRTVDQLARDMEKKFDDLKQVQYDLRQLEVRMM